MGQQANSGRNANLDEKKTRSAGRNKQQSPERNAIKDFQQPLPAKGKTSGAFGKENQANRRDSGAVRGGAGSSGLARDEAVPASTRPARRRGATAAAKAKAGVSGRKK